MSNWSSYPEQQLLTENWRNFLNEEEIDEGLYDRLKQTATGAYKGGKEAWEKSRPKDIREYPADAFTTILNLISNAVNKLDLGNINIEKIRKELEGLLEKHNFVIKEQNDSYFLGLEDGEELVLDLESDEIPNLKSALKLIGEKNPNYLKQIISMFEEGGFTIKSKTTADEPEPEPEAPEADEPAAAEPTAATEPTTAGAAKKDVYIFRGKSGKGVQSQLAKAGIKGKTLGIILKALAADLSGAGFNVLEEKKSRRVIDAPKTILALSKMEDGEEKNKIKKVIVDLLRNNGIKLNPESSKALAASSAQQAQIASTAGTDAPAAEPEPAEDTETELPEWITLEKIGNNSNFPKLKLVDFVMAAAKEAGMPILSEDDGPVLDLVLSDDEDLAPPTPLEIPSSTGGNKSKQASETAKKAAPLAIVITNWLSGGEGVEAKFSEFERNVDSKITLNTLWYYLSSESFPDSISRVTQAMPEGLVNAATELLQPLTEKHGDKALSFDYQAKQVSGTMTSNSYPGMMLAETNNLLSESEIKRWQVIAGINKKVL